MSQNQASRTDAVATPVPNTTTTLHHSDIGKAPPEPAAPQAAGFPRSIELVGVRTNNLAGFDLQIPLGQLTAICGVSGSGKSSLAFDTLFAEGQRRYIESFPVRARQHLPKFDRPDVDHMANLPPAIAISQWDQLSQSSLSLAQVVGLWDDLRVLFGQLAETNCPHCGQTLRRYTPAQAATALVQQFTDQEIILAIRLHPPDLNQTADMQDWGQQWSARGFPRVLLDQQLYRWDQLPTVFPAARQTWQSVTWRLVIDRVKVADTPKTLDRLRESLETAYALGDQTVSVLSFDQIQVIQPGAALVPDRESVGTQDVSAGLSVVGAWQQFSQQLQCGGCGQVLPTPHPRLFQLDRQANACPECAGTGHAWTWDRDRVLPDPERTLLGHAVAPLASRGPKEIQQWLDSAHQAGLPLDKPIRQFSPRQMELLWSGTSGTTGATATEPIAFTGLVGLLAGLQAAANKPKKATRASAKGTAANRQPDLSEYRRPNICPTCHGLRFRAEILAHRVAGLTFPEWLALPVEQVQQRLVALVPADTAVAELSRRLQQRLAYLFALGLGYLTLDRPASSLAVGEARRVALTKAFGSQLSRTLFVLDEPTAGLHPADTQQLLPALRQLLMQGNTVVVVDHDEQLLRAADFLVELGPGAGLEGGQLLVAATPAAVCQHPDSITGPYLRRGPQLRSIPRQPKHWLELEGAKRHHLQDLNVRFPLGVLCVVAGVSGAGKSTLLFEELWPRLQAVMQGQAELPLGLRGARKLKEVVLVDAHSLGRTQRGNAASYLKFFDEIRKLFAEQLEARLRGLSAGDFSFNNTAGRCERCEGMGQLTVDMQFLPSLHLVCPDCDGQRYQPRVLAVKFRGRNIHEVLQLTVREAFSFFRGEVKIQQRLKYLLDVGLDYLQIGQPLNTLSGGEGQRLKLATYLTPNTTGPCLFLLEEPTTGLHPKDLETLFPCFDALIQAGHSLFVVEHNPRVLLNADYIIELGPGGGAAGGRLIATGTPKEVAQQDTPTGHLLAHLFTNINLIES